MSQITCAGPPLKIRCSVSTEKTLTFSSYCEDILLVSNTAGTSSYNVELKHSTVGTKRKWHLLLKTHFNFVAVLCCAVIMSDTHRKAMQSIFKCSKTCLVAKSCSCIWTWHVFLVHHRNYEHHLMFFVNFASDWSFCFCSFRSFCSCLIEPVAKSPELQELIEVNLEFQVQFIHLSVYSKFMLSIMGKRHF